MGIREYKVKIRVGGTFMGGITYAALTPAEAARKRISVLVPSKNYDAGTVLVEALSTFGGLAGDPYVFDWTRRRVTTTNIELS